MCNLMENGGLGIMDLGLKNRALLNKWFWRYADEPNALWKSIIVSKYGGDLSDLIPNIGHHRRFSSMWKNIVKVSFSNNMFFDIFSSGVGFSIGDGSKIRFWLDAWIDGVTLKFTFSRIYALSINKGGKVREFGCWINDKWQWRILLRRRLFGWELQQWNDFSSTIKGYIVCANMKDTLIWKGSPDENYFAKYFCKTILKNNCQNKEIWKMV